MEIIGRLTADATVATVSDDKQVVNFDIAMNDSYKPKGGEKKTITNYVQCAYWISTAIADKLTRGTIVSLFGRIGVNAYINQKGDAVGKLTFHVNNIKFISGGKGDEAAQHIMAQETADTHPTKKDLPF